MKIAIIGTRGIPNNYGGFETLAEYLAINLFSEIEITVFCSTKDLSTKLSEYHGARLKYVNVSSHGAWGILYDSISLLKSYLYFDKVLMLGFGCGFILPFLKKHKDKFIVNFGGLDWKRSKWSYIEQRLIKFSEKNLVRYSRTVIADNIGIQEYIKNEYQKESVFIAYGGDQARRLPKTKDFEKRYPFLRSEYAFIVTRIQPDNNIEMMLNAFGQADKIPLVIVGNWDNSVYGKDIKRRYHNNENIVLLDAIYDRSVLDVLRSNCTVYIHGHSAGGTNPSLVEAMYLGLPVFAFASGYNEFTTENNAVYFKDEKDLSQKLLAMNDHDLSEMGKELKKIAETRYTWDKIASEYKNLFMK
jgi:glycosyltransferase involved in cell wall biosynthesis